MRRFLESEWLHGHPHICCDLHTMVYYIEKASVDVLDFGFELLPMAIYSADFGFVQLTMARTFD